MNRASRFFLAAALALMTLTTQAWAVAPDALARNVTNEVMDILRQDKDLRNGNSPKILALVEQKILPHFDFQQMMQLAMGRNWARATPEQQRRLVEEFKTLLVRTYSASLTSVLDYRIEFLPLRMAPGANEVTVNTVVGKSGAPPLPIDYRMERQGDTWKVFDVRVEGVSLVTVYRNSFNAEVRKGGIDGLLATLSRRNQQQAAVAGP